MKNKEHLPIELMRCIHVDTDMVLSFSYYVFLYVLDGEVSISLGAEPVPYAASEVLLLPAGVSASVTAAGSCRLLLLGLSTDYVQNNLNLSVLPVCNSVLNPNPDYFRLKQHILDTYEEYRSREQSDLAVLGNLYLLLHELRRLPGSVPQIQTGNRYTQRVQEIANYIDQHYAEPLSLSDLAREFYLAPQYLSTFFKENFKTNFKSYLNDKRLFYSLRDLRQTDLSIGEIAVRCGFTSASAYRKNFEARYHITPTGFRLQHQNEVSVQADPNSSLLAEADAPVRAGVLRQTFRVNYTSQPQAAHHCTQMLNVGAASNLLSASYRNYLTSYLSETGIRCIRIQEVMSNAFIPMLLPNYDYYLQNVTSMVSYLEEIHVTPIIELSRGQFYFQTQGDTSQYVRYPSRKARFMRLLEAFLAHVYRHWSMEWLNQWRFELWMQPLETLEGYAADYVAIRDLIHRYIPGAAVGGPGYHKCATPVSSAAFMQYFRQQHIPMDFYSIYLDYRDYDADTHEITMSRNPDYLVETCLAIRGELSRYLPQTPLYATEWNSMYLPGIPLAYSRYQSAFIARNGLGISQLCDLSGYWLFADYQSHHNQLLEQSDLFMDGQGLYTKNMLPTSAYYAYRLCCSLGSEYVAFGSNYCLIHVNAYHFQLLAWHYIHPRNAVSAEFNNAYAYDKVYTMFPETPGMEAHFYINNVEPGSYQIQRQVIDETSGNLLDILIGSSNHSNINREAYLQNVRTFSPAERVYYETALQPEFRKIYTRAEHTLHIESYLMPHSVCLWDIRRLL